MTACGCYLESTLHTLLTTNIAEVELIMVLLLIELLAGVNDGRLIAGVTIHELDDICQRLHAIHLQLVDYSRLADVLLGHDEALELLLASPDGNGQGSANGLQAAVQSQFTYHHIMVQPVALHFAIGCKDSYGQRQVIARSFLLDVGR